MILESKITWVDWTQVILSCSLLKADTQRLNRDTGS